MTNQDPIYRKKVYQALKGELGNSFSKTEEEFNNLLDTDKSYANKVYSALKGELGNSFTKTEEEFLSSVYSNAEPTQEDPPQPKKKETSVSPSTSEGEVGISEYSIEQKDEAQNSLVKEAQNKGIRNFSFNDNEITQRAKELKNKKTETSWLKHHFGWVEDFVSKPQGVTPHINKEIRRAEDGITNENISWVEESAYKFNAGLNTLASQLLDIPKLLTETRREITKPILNTVIEYAGIDNEKDAENITNAIITEIDKIDPLVAIAEKGNEAAKDGYRLAKENHKGLKEYEQGIFDSFKNGDFSDGIRQITGAIAETTPNTLFMLGTGGTGAVTSATGYAAQTRTENDALKEKGELNKGNQAILFNAYLNGGFEFITDKLLLKVGKANKELFKSLGKKTVKEETENAFKEIIKTNLGEAVGEMATQIGQNASDILVLDKNIKIMDGALDAGIVGLANSGAMSSPAVIAYGANKLITKKEQAELDNKKRIIKEVQKTILTETDKETITHLGNIIKENTNDIKSFFDKKVESFEQIPDTEKKQVFEKIQAINKSKKILSNDNISEPLKEFERKKIDGYKSEITLLLENAISKKVETKTQPDVSESDYNTFVDTGNVSSEILNTLAEKTKNKQPLTERETAIFNNKTTEINEILREQAKQENTVQETEQEILSTEDKENKKNIIETIKGLFLKNKDTSIPNKSEKLTVVKSTVAEKIKNLTGIDVSGYSHSISISQINHTIKNHSDKLKEEKRGQIPITEKDFERLPDVFENPDTIEYAGKNKIGRETIKYTKTFDDGTTVVYEAILGKKKKELEFSTMFKLKNQDEKMRKTPARTSETLLDSSKSTITDGLMPTRNSPSPITSETLPAPSKPTSSTANIQKNETQTQGDTIANQDVRVRAGENDGKGQGNEVQSTPNVEANTKSPKVNRLQQVAKKKFNGLVERLKKAFPKNKVITNEAELQKYLEDTGYSFDDTKQQIETTGKEIVQLFKDAVNGKLTGKPVSVGSLTKQGRAFLENISGLKFKEKIDFVLNPSDLNHIYKDHYKKNEKDTGNNIPLTDADIKAMAEVIYKPDEIVFLGYDKTTQSNKFAFLKSNEKGTYNLLEVYSGKKGNLTAKTYFNTKKDISQRIIDLKKPLFSTSETNFGASPSLKKKKGSDQRAMDLKKSPLSNVRNVFGASLSLDAKIPILFERSNLHTKQQIIGKQGAKALDQAEERTHRIDNLATAREMETANKDAKAIKLATGWERGADGKWRYEIPDVDVSQTANPTNSVKEWFKEVVGNNNPDNFTLGDLIKEISSEASSLLGIPLNVINAYPQLKGIRFKTHKANERKASGFYSVQEDLFSEDKFKTISLREDLSTHKINSVLLHEIQHAIQDIEGFEKGTTSKKGRDNYKKSSGETEARNVQSRLGMTEEQRRNTLLSETEDVAREDQLFLRGENSGIAFSEDVQEIKTLDRIKLTGLDKSTPVLPSSVTLTKVVNSFEKPNTRYLKDKKGEVYGAVFPDGTIFLDENKANYNTPIHEFAHVWIDALKGANEELHNTGIRLIKKSKYYKDLKKDKNYKHLTDEQIAEEALATAIGDKGEHFWSTQKKTYPPFMNWLNNFKNWLTDKFFINQKEGIKDLTLDQFLDASLHDLLGGKEIKYNKTNFKLGGNSYKVINKNGTLTVKDSRGRIPSKPTERKVLREYAEQYDFTLGERFTITDDITPSDDIDSEIAQNSNNPAELAEVALRTKTKDFINDNSDTDAIEIIEYVQGNVKRGIRNSKGNDGSFINQSDTNNITNAVAKTYLKKDGKGLDVLAQELSEKMGRKITEQDIVDIILAYPNGVNDVQKEVRDRYSNTAKQRFTELTGLPSSDWYLEKAVEQDIAKERLAKAQEQDYLNHFAEEDLLSLEQEQNEFKDYEKANEQRDEVVFKTSDTSQNESRPRVQEKSDSVSRTEESGARIKREAEEVFTGRLILNRLPPKAERGRIKGGRRNVEASLVVGKSDGTAKNLESKQTELEKQQLQEEQLRAYAKEEGIWFEENHNFGQPYDKGQEAKVHLNKDGKTVTKVINPYIFSLNPQEFLDRIAIRNTLFPETALTLKGFTTENGEFRFVLEQPFIKKSNEILTSKEINDFLNSIGYKDNGSGTFTNDYYILEDLHNGNIVKGIDGNLYAIDVVTWLNTAKEGYGGKQVHNEIIPVKKSTLKKGSENLQALDDTLKQWEDKLNQFGKGTLGMNMPVAVAQGMIKTMRLAVKTAKTTLDVLEAGRNYVRNTDWYKNLSETEQNNVEKTLTDDRNVFNNMDKIIDDAVEKARKEEKNKANKRAKKLKETTKKLREKYADIQQYKNEVVNEIRQRLKTDTLSHLTKTDIASVLRQMNNAKTFKRVDALVDKVDFILTRGEYKKATFDLKKLLQEPRKFLKSVNGQPKANRVDNETRKLFNRIFSYLSSNSTQLKNLLNKVDAKIANGDISERTLNEKVAIESAIQIQDATDLFEASKEVVNRKNNAENAERLHLATELKQRAFNDLETLLNEGRYKLKEQIKVEAKRLREITDNFTESTNHKWNDIATNTEKRNAQINKKNSVFSKILNTPKAIKRFFTKPVTNSFEFLLGYFDQTANHGEGNPYQHFYSGENGIVQADANFKKDQKSIKTEVQNGLKKILGTKLNWLYNAHKHEQKISKEKDSKIFLLKDGKREVHSQTISIGQALYVHLVSKMPDVKRKLEEQGWDDVAMLQLEDFLGEEFLKVSDFMTTYLSLKYDKYNTTYNELLRTDLGFEDGYFPLKYINADLTMEVDLAGSKFALPSVSNGHLKNKVANKNRIDTTADAFNVFNGYLDSMERFCHYGRFTKDLNAVLSNKAIRNNMKTFDEQAFKDFEKLSKVVIGDASEIRAHQIENKIYKYNSAIAAGYIGYKGYTALKQFLSMPAYTEKSNDIHIGFNGNKVRIPLAGKLFFGGKMLVNLNPISVWNSYRFLKKNSSHFSSRIDKGTIGDEFIDNLFKQNSSSLYSKALKYIAKKGITPNKFIDAITISTGGKVYYDQQFKKYKKAGIKESEAHTKAIRDFEISFKLTQQSSDASDLSIIQHSKGVMTSLFVPFKNSQFSYFRRISANSNNILRRYKNEKDRLQKEGHSTIYSKLKAFKKISKEGQTYRDLENVLLYTHVLPLLWQYVGSGLPGLLTAWDDDDTDEMIRAGALGLFDGVFILSDATKWAYNTAVLGKNWKYETSIIMSEMQTIFNDIIDVWTDAGEVNEDVLLEVGKGYLKTKSINTDTFQNVYKGAENMILEGDFSQKNIMTLLNAPKELRGRGMEGANNSNGFKTTKYKSEEKNYVGFN